ncbi:hypothetical protein F5Y00DRAFT_261925 [Daldinia vernicosa]|uniref:uncharacterized protein n=1 Tax=Daldinia vernicosa TaxID=114800 RepID=UPI002007AFD6|nr:uncharacterized protein F5Y00DRAFT_261925 [Daldinia vernicosa]KAI0849109.1 hypothetical protein F5Y00DRAFT_261925 [Daldinia vernicosa]
MAEEEPLYYMRPGHVIAAATVLSAIDIFVVGLRFWARKVMKQPLRADDWLMLPATLLTVGIGICQLYGVSQKALGYRTVIPDGFQGNPFELVTPQLRLKSQLEWTFFLMLPIATGCMKASFLFFYIRVFATQERSAINKFLKAFIVFIVVWAVAFFFGMFFECGRNFWAIWNSQVEFRAHCSSNTKLILALCITDFIADVFIICIPIPLVLRLQLSPRKKLGVCSLFLLGSGTVIASIVRFVLMAGSYLGSVNITNDSILGTTACLYWGMVECGIGMLAACLPTIQFLFRKWIWEPVLLSTKSIFSSQSTQATRISWADGSHQASIHVQQTFRVSYDQVHDSSSRSISPNNLPNVSNERLVRESYPMQDKCVRTVA